MNRALLLAGATALVAASMAGSEKAHACSVLSHHPCTPYVGSVFRRQPFTPYSCGVTGGPCSPQVVLMIGGMPVLRIEGHSGPSDPVDRGRPLERFEDIARVLSQCLELPPGDASRAGMQLALRFAFKRNGELLADPRFTYTTGDAPENVKAAWRAAALDMLKRCTPLPITDRFGAAIAGRPVVAAIRETRDLAPGVGHPDAGPPESADDHKPDGARPDDPKPDDPKPDDPKP